MTKVNFMRESFHSVFQFKQELNQFYCNFWLTESSKKFSVSVL